MSKRGQSIGMRELFYVLLAVAAVVIIVLGLYTNWKFFTDLPGKIDFDMTLYEQKCINTVSLGGFCTNTMLVGENTYVNCQYAIDVYGAEKPDGAPQCSTDYKLNSQQICNLLEDKEGEDFKPDKVEVNGQSCSYWFNKIQSCTGTPDKICGVIKNPTANNCPPDKCDFTAATNSASATCTAKENYCTQFTTPTTCPAEDGCEWKTPAA